MQSNRIWLTLVLSWLSGSARSAPVTFNKDIAPLVFEHCAACHRPGQSAPFPLLSYSDVQPRAKKIMELVSRRAMPPWLPEGDFGQFVGDRRLSTNKIEKFQEWVRAGMPEGAAVDLPAPPEWDELWQLGKPDLVVRMPKQYILSATGQDIYRNFVIPTALDRPHYIRAVEFRPDNRRIVHHAFVKVDASGQVQRLDGKDGQPGFDGMNVPESVRMPQGYFLSYQPGKMPASEPPGFGWTLEPGQNLVVQTHLRPTGKPEQLQAQVGLYFTDIQPTNVTRVFALGSLNIDLAPGTNAELIEDRFTMPVDGDLLAVLPHTHYLGKRLQGFATFPDGRTQQLISIPRWDFNWQGDYRYARPVHVPAGTILEMKYVFDNSASNPFNPNQPPKEVFCGPQSTDEMAELWFQVLVQGTNDAARIAEAYNGKNARMFTSYAEFRLQRNPKDARARTELGFLQWTSGQAKQAMESFQTAIQDDPRFDQPHYYMGVIYRLRKDLRSATVEFEKAIELNPNNARAFGNLAFVFVDLGKLERAERCIRRAIELDPTDQLSKETLDQIRELQKRSKSAG
jgi:cytochrome c-type biogenesis protein CcmH/NrfG